MQGMGCDGKSGKIGTLAEAQAVGGQVWVSFTNSALRFEHLKMAS